MTSNTGGRKLSRRRFLKMAVGGTLVIGGAGIGVSFYTTRIEPSWLSITRLTMPIPNLPPAFKGFTIAQISDLHFGDAMTPERMGMFAQQVNDLNPDVIAVTGDFVSGLYRAGVLEQMSSSIRSLHAREGVYAILGNHDHWYGREQTIRAVEQAGNVHLLINGSTAFKRGSESFYLAGVDDIWERQHDLNKALAAVPPGAPTILMAHEGDYADESAQDRRVALQLSGHSHGGQVRLPGKGALILPHLGQKYDMGLYQIGEMKLYVNRGLGMIAPYVRFNCPPEVTVFTLVPA